MEFFTGAIAGGVGTLIGHPLDIFKARTQAGKRIKIDYSLTNGLYSAMGISGISSSVCFGVAHSNMHIGSYQAGAIAGFFNGILSNPLELIKIQQQLGKKVKVSSILRGMPLTLTREIVSNSLYFGVYDDLQSSIGTFHAGGLAGVASWLSTYPVDVIKTRVQSNLKLSYNDAVLKRNLWSGLSYCLIRAYIVNSISFVVFEKLTVNLKT